MKTRMMLRASRKVVEIASAPSDDQSEDENDQAARAMAPRAKAGYSLMSIGVVAVPVEHESHPDQGEDEPGELRRAQTTTR